MQSDEVYFAPTLRNVSVSLLGQLLIYLVWFQIFKEKVEKVVIFETGGVIFGLCLFKEKHTFVVNLVKPFPSKLF